MKVNITKANETAVKEAITITRELVKAGGITKTAGYKVINNLKNIIEKHEVRKAKDY